MNWTVPFAAPNKVGDPWLRRLIAAAGRRWDAYRRWRAEQIAIEQLGAMSDRDLKDIGLIRSEIGIAVHIEPFAAACLGGNEPQRFKWRCVNRSIR